MRREINVFKCIVNISSQDFGIYRNLKVNVGARSKAEQHGPAETSLVKLEDGVVESQSSVGEVDESVDWRFWTLNIFMKLCLWLAELGSLLGWLWWQWEVAWEGM